jgi:uncharacterized protein YsxB (DUF464 family)
MLTVTARRCASGLYFISAEGHAGYADEGWDVVCAAVSTLMQALRVGVEDVLGLKGTKFFSDPAIPFMSIEWDGADRDAQQLARTILLSLRGVEAAYSDFVNIVDVSEEEGNYDRRD